MAHTIVTHEINPIQAQRAYDIAIEALTAADLSKGEALVGLFVIIGTQYFGGPMPPKLTSQFVGDITDWLTAYFGIGAGEAKN